jgi:hypothetical protein
MRTGKRALAGVAAGALALGMLSIAGASTATAAKSIKPKATKTATVSAVRATGVTSPLSIPEAKMSWTGAGSFTNASGLNVLRLTTAPTATAILTVDDSTGTGDDTATLGQTATAINFTSGDDSSVRFNVDTAGTYVGSIANGTDTVSFSFATAGAPTSMTLTPATQTVLVGATADVTITLKDAAGNTTQPQTVDSVTLASSGDDTVGTTPLTGAKGGALQYGTFDDTVRTQTAGTSTLTATPLGTLPGSGVTAQTASLVKSGTVSNVPVIGIGVTTPANAVNAGTNPTARTSFVPEGTTTLVVTVDDTTGAAAGNALRFQASLSGAGTVNGVNTLVDELFIDVTTNASKKATISLTVGGAGVIAGSALTLTQVNVADAVVASGGVDVINWQTPAVQPANIVPTPTTALAALGASTPITVQVDDSFGVDQAGWTVTAYRGTVSGPNFLSSGVTNSAGSASVTVSPLSTVVNLGTETYVYTAQPPVGAVVNGSVSTTVTYTTSGGITSLSVANGASATACSNSSCTLATYPTILVPSSGVVSAVASAGIYTVASGTVTTAATTNMMTFTPTTSPVNTVTVTVPEGVKVSSTLPTATTLWSAGAQTASVTSGSPVYVWSTKTGTHNITVASGGLSVTNKLRVVNRNTDAYNIAVSPATQTLATGGFGTATVTITDVFGNIVAGTSDDSGAVTVAASGEILLGGFTASQTVRTGTAGTGTVTLIAGNTAGAGLLTVTPLSGTLVPAWQTSYTPPTGAPAPVTSASATITVGEGPVTKSITISGSRTTVGGKPGIEVDGITVGFENGKTVIPYFRFPGETSYTEGTARPVITDDEFTWTRKTGKKFYAYVTSDDGAVQSNRVIIDAN